MIFLKIFLFPLALIYGAITRIRNFAYSIGLFDENVIPKPSIVIGNLTVGGTGKTPMTEYIISLFHQQYKVSMLSRGYGRKTKGFIEADSTSNASIIGDEPFQVYSKFKDTVHVFVGENRRNAIQQIVSKYPSTQLVVLDDAYQHRAVKASINILLCDYYRPFYKDYLLPFGLLRESRHGAKRADAIVVTKCPPLLSDKSKIDITRQIRNYTKIRTPIFFAHFTYATPISEHNQEKLDKNTPVFLFSGIANDLPLVEYVKNNYKYHKHITFNDHHFYTQQDIEHITFLLSKCPANTVLMTTEKDFGKLQSSELRELLKNYQLYYLPVAFNFSEQAKEFESFLLEKLNLM
ncbi:MAG: tetraacyldisaccharide 4'-kinase [Cytophagales bacterium]|nr:MAG: tetraacyldisaccharide 4'-kinase [Cytophagales bacterium]